LVAKRARQARFADGEFRGNPQGIRVADDATRPPVCVDNGTGHLELARQPSLDPALDDLIDEFMIELHFELPFVSLTCLLLLLLIT
jgi:hypothetical protein